MTASALSLPPFSLNINVPTLDAPLTAYRPDNATVSATAAVAKQIFMEAFRTTYTEYHQTSKSTEPIETWLKLKSGTFLAEWLENTFDEEYQEYIQGEKGFIFLQNSNKELVGWLSHGAVSAEGDLYLSQCSLKDGWRRNKVASTVFSEVIHHNHLNTLFPGVKNVKLIAREINKAAFSLYTGAGFIMDETIDPTVYGSSYNNCYVGYRLEVKPEL